MIISFGKYQGLDSSIVPVEYLEWCVENMSWVHPEIIHELKVRSKHCSRCAASVLLVGKGSKKKQKKFYRNKDVAKRAESRRAKDCAPRTIVGEHYEAMREQWELAGGDSSQCPFGDDYSGPFLGWDGDEAVIRMNLREKASWVR